MVFVKFLIPTWVTPQCRATSKKIYMCVCSTNLGFSGGLANRYCCRTPRQYDTRYVLCTRYVCTWHQPAEIYTYVRGGTHDTYVPPVDAHVWRQLHLSVVARCSDSYCIFVPGTCMRRPGCCPGAWSSWYLQVASLHLKSWTSVSASFTFWPILPCERVQRAAEAARGAKRLACYT